MLRGQKVTVAQLALNRLERYSECIIKARKGLEYAPGNVGLVDAISRANRALIVQKLKGKWHGVVDAALGGYTQELDFVSDTKVIVHVLGTTVEAQIDLNTNIDPPHLDMSVPSQPEVPSLSIYLNLWTGTSTWSLHTSCHHLYAPQRLRAPDLW